MRPKSQLYFLLMLFGCILILLSSCTTTGSAQNQTPQEPSQKLLLFQKTPCFGTCPAYNATFYTDGSVLFEGFRYVPVTDTVRLQLTKEQLNEVKLSLKQLNYTSLENTYLSNYTDLPSTYLTFYENNREVKRLKHQVEGPATLQRTIKQLHELVMQLVTEK